MTFRQLSVQGFVHLFTDESMKVEGNVFFFIRVEKALPNYRPGLAVPRSTAPEELSGPIFWEGARETRRFLW